jgi:LysR family transcriptional regulator, hydrogen peroxide-inducible genes activator
MSAGFTLRQLEYLVAVEDHGGFSAAARAVHVSQPGLTEQIGRLEQVLDVRLIERSGRTVRLTEAGRRVTDRARSVLAAAEDLRTEAVAGDLFTVAAIPTAAPYLLPGLFAAQSHARFLPVQAPTAAAAELLDSGRCDAAVLAAGTVPDRFDTVEVGTEPLFVVVPAGPRYDHVVDGEVTLDVLASLEMVLLDGEHCLRDQVVDLCRRVGRHRFRRPLEAASLELVVALVAAGAGATVVPAVAVASVSATPNVRFARFAPPSAPSRTLLLARRHGPDRDTEPGGPFDRAVDLLAGSLADRVAAADAVLAAVGQVSSPRRRR